MLEYLTKNKTLYDLVPLVETWFGLDEFQGHHLVAPLSPVARLLLTSDGSMTQMLESLLLVNVSMSIERQEILPRVGVFDGIAGFDLAESALAREAWLTDGQRSLVYAHSLLFAAGSEDYSLDGIREVTKPLGKMLPDKDIKTSRERHMMGRIKSPEISGRFGLSLEEELWARYYLLDTDVGLKGLVFEVFRPDLFEM